MSNEEELAEELKKLRTNFYQTNYQLMVGVLVFMLAINIVLTGIIFYYIVTRPEPTYFATSQSGELTQIHALSDPIVNNQDILQWANNIANIAYTFNFVNYNDVPQKLQKYFTDEGLAKFKNNFQSPSILNPIIAQKIVVSSDIKGMPQILAQGVNRDGRYNWKVQIPLLITYQSPTTITQQQINLTMLIIRVSTTDVAVADIVATNTPIPKTK